MHAASRTRSIQSLSDERLKTRLLDKNVRIIKKRITVTYSVLFGRAKMSMLEFGVTKKGNIKSNETNDKRTTCRYIFTCPIVEQ